MRDCLVWGAVAAVLFFESAVPRSTASAWEFGAYTQALSLEREDADETQAVTATAVQTQEEAVVLLDGGAPIDSDDIVATLGTLLRSGGFRPEVVGEVQSRYFGYMIDRREREGRWELAGPIQAFTARYGSGRTAGWPDRTGFIYNDSRANAALVVPVLPEENVAEAANLRIYYRPDRVGYRGGQYDMRDVLMMVYLDPESGRQSTYAYRPENDVYQLYRYTPPGIPSRPRDTSVVSDMVVATTDTIRVQVFIASVSVPVPRHTYSGGLFRVFEGRNYEGTATPMGPPIQFSGLSQEEGMAPFTAALKAHQEGRRLTDKEFADVHRYIRHIHQYLVEKPQAGT
jgi:hypothetical protein